MDSPTSGPEELNTHPHSEQAQPWKFLLSAHISLRRIAVIARSGTICGYVSLKDGQALLFNDTRDDESRSSHSPGQVLPRLLPFDTAY
jgi:hypothetical protein